LRGSSVSETPELGHFFTKGPVEVVSFTGECPKVIDRVVNVHIFFEPTVISHFLAIKTGAKEV